MSNTSNGETNNLAPFNPSSETAQNQSLAMMNLRSDDVLFDLGCGDARILIRAVSQVEGVRCVGVEIDPVFVTRAKAAIDDLPAETRARIDIRCEDATQVLPDDEARTDGVGGSIQDVIIDDATVLYLYLLPRGLCQIQTLLDEIVNRRKRRGASLRVVAYTFQVQGWDPVRVDHSTKSGVPIYLYEF
jgi:precorrin-6B methylase 2